MEFTFDHFIFLFGIAFGVGLTIIGISFTEWLKSRKLKKRLISALYEEARTNVKKTQINAKFSNNKGPTPFVPFHTIAYEQYKLALMINERSIPGLSEILVNAYTVAEMFNRKIDEYEKDRMPQDEKLMFGKIESWMKEICDELGPYIKEEKP
jgi:hypothetical protein